MTCYLVQPTDLIFVKGYGFMSFTKDMGRNIGENINKSLNGKYSQKILDHAQQFVTDTLKMASKRTVQNPAEANGGFIGNKMLIELQKSGELCHRIIQN